MYFLTVLMGLVLVLLANVVAGWGGEEPEHSSATEFDLRTQLEELASNQHYMVNFQNPDLAKEMLQVFNLRCLKSRIAGEIAALNSQEFECVQERAAVALKSLNSTDLSCFQGRVLDLIAKMDEKCYKRKLFEQLSHANFKLYKFATVMVECFDPSVLGLLKYDCFSKLKSIGFEILVGCVKTTRAPLVNMFIDCMDFHTDSSEEVETEKAAVAASATSSDMDAEAPPAKAMSVPLEPTQRLGTPSCMNNSNCKDVNTWEGYCCDDLKKCCDLLKYTFKDSNRLYNFLVVYREPRTVYTTVMYGLPVLTLFVIGCVGILLSDLYSFCHYLFCRRCIRCCMRRRKKSTDEKYYRMSRDVSQNALLDGAAPKELAPISSI